MNSTKMTDFSKGRKKRNATVDRVLVIVLVSISFVIEISSVCQFPMVKGSFELRLVPSYARILNSRKCLEYMKIMWNFDVCENHAANGREYAKCNIHNLVQQVFESHSI